MKVVLVLLIIPVLLSIGGCTSSDTPNDGSVHSSFGGPVAMPGSDSNASDNRY